jgi:acyl-coenzyme A synthetase/AMP-(fatty) acid ligase
MLRTGDVGRLADGRLFLEGRLARVAKPLGVRVQLEEIEAAFQPDGAAAAVAGPDEVVTVYVEGPTASFREAYRAVLAGYRLPPAAVRLVSVERIPRTASGKIAYGELAGE